MKIISAMTGLDRNPVGDPIGNINFSLGVMISLREESR